MGSHPQIESAEHASFLTTRSRNSELWFVNNEKLERAVLGYLAKYAETREATLYAFAIEGNHNQSPARFPKENRADFMRDFNSSVARTVPRYCPKHKGGQFWHRRYSAEFLPGAEDIEEYFFYTVLQPVQDGLVERISDYPGYNCFHDAVHGIEREYEVLDIKAFNAARKRDKAAPLKDFIKTHTLRYARLPGYEHLTQQEYSKLMHRKLEERRLEIVKRRRAQGKGFLGRDALLRTLPGARPKNTKTSKRGERRPRVLSVCNQRRAHCREWYYAKQNAYREASARYRAGDLSVEFPHGMYKPYIRTQPPPE